MLKKVFSIRDSKGEVFLTPWHKNTHGEAERDFKEVANSKDTMLGKYPEDYDLYYLGEFDDNSGKFIPLDTPQHIVKAVQLLNQTN